MNPAGKPLPRSFFARAPEIVASDLIGRVLVVPAGAGLALASAVPGAESSDAQILLRLTETEAYHGEQDPASHAYRGLTARTAPMFGPPGFLYTYFVYGMHWCANIVTGSDGEASAVLMRAAAVVGNPEAVRERRRSAAGKIPRDVDLASGPARLASCIRLGRDESGADLCAPHAPFTVCAGDGQSRTVVAGPRVGVAAGAETLWRFYEADEPTVTTYRKGGRRVRESSTG
ncbi:MAG: DNA-3-methyladenine glycosylase [Nakamurella sp.]